MQESRRASAAEVGSYGAITLGLELLGHRGPAAWRVGPAMKQKYERTVFGASCFVSDLQNVCVDCPNCSSTLPLTLSVPRRAYRAVVSLVASAARLLKLYVSLN